MRIALLTILSSFMLVWACDNPPSQGEQLYTYFCANCHMPEGTGLAKLIPPIADADYLYKNWNQLACIIRNGQAQKITVNGTTYSEPMPGNAKLTETEIINIISYIRDTWYPEITVQSPAEIRANLKDCSVSK